MKVICSPVSEDAMERLNFGIENDGDLLMVIIGDEVYKRMWRLGFFDEINQVVNKYIDDYEDENITSIFDLIKLKNINCKYIKKGGVFIEIEKLILNAIENNTGVFFFF